MTHDQLTHTERPVVFDGFGRTSLQLAHRPPARLIIFVHGWSGDPLETWHEFDRSGRISDWWRESDLLFVGYASTKLDPTGVADELRRLLPGIYPRLPHELLVSGGTAVRAVDLPAYRELSLVGHSLGAVIVRRIAADLVKTWMHDKGGDLTDARVHLFSPATEGFAPSGSLAQARALFGTRVFDIVLGRAPAWRDLKAGSPVLRHLREDTEELAEKFPEVLALRPRILWANPDRIVQSGNYRTDPPSFSQLNVSHRSVCKPNDRYPIPWQFVETGTK